MNDIGVFHEVWEDLGGGVKGWRDVYICIVMWS